MLAGGSEARHAIDNGKSISPGLAGNVEQRRGLPVAGDDPNMIFRPQSDGRHIANSEAVADDDSTNILGGARFLRCYDQVLLVVLRQAPNRAHSGRLSDRGGKIVIGETLRGQAGRVRDDLDLANIASLHIHPPYARHAGDERPELVARDVVQRGRIAALEIVGQNRKQRWRHSLDFEVELAGK